MKNSYISEENENEDFNLRDTLEQYVDHWRWFVLSVCLCFIVAYVYLRYATPLYQASTTILVKDEKKGGISSELSAFSDMGLGAGMKNNLDNEIEILKSRTLIEKTVKKLRLNVSMTSNGNVISTEFYKNAPIEVLFIGHDSDIYKNSMVFEFVSLSPNTFELTTESKIDGAPVFLNNKKEFRYGEIIATKNGGLMITKATKYTPKNNMSISIAVSPFKNVVASFQGRLNVSPVSKTSSVVTVSITDPLKNKAEIFLDNLIQIYNEDAAKDKSAISEKTSEFVANRLFLISKELDGVEQDVERFKSSNKLTDIETEAKLYIEGSNEYNKKGVEVEIQLNMVASMLEFIKKSNNLDLLPDNIISTEGEVSGLINSYNKLILERNRILKSATADNPTVVKLDQQIASLKSNAAASLFRIQANLQIQRRDLKSHEALLDSKIGEIPVQERQFRVIARQQKVKEELYLYLLQKREETAIAMAATAPNARVIDVAKASDGAVAPKKPMFYLGALLLGLLVPFGILYAIDLLDTKVKNRFDITNKMNIPFLGDIPNSTTPNEVIESTSRSGTAEALRIVMTNLNFMLTQVIEGDAKVVFLTSTIPGEGKTFLSVNLAGALSPVNKKVLLIGMDVRNPKLSEYLELPNTSGLTDYLSSHKAVVEDYIFKSKEVENLYVLPAGIIPPNPTELLMNKKVEELFVQFKKEYDYIIVDMAPVSMVSDTLLLSKYADATVYVVRANYLDKKMLHFPKTLYKEGKLNNMAVVLNDTPYNKNYRYGYGIRVEEKPWYKKILNT